MIFACNFGNRFGWTLNTEKVCMCSQQSSLYIYVLKHTHEMQDKTQDPQKSCQCQLLVRGWRGAEDAQNEFSYLPKISLSSCSETNWPRLATKSVEHGPLAPLLHCAGPLLAPGWEHVDPTGEARAGEGRKWGMEVACIELRAAVGWGIESGCCKFDFRSAHKKLRLTHTDK